MGKFVVSEKDWYAALVAQAVPATVEVAGVSIRVVVDKDDPQTHGGWDYETLTITLTEKCGESAWRSLWHEMGHASLALSGMSEVLASYDDNLEETLMTMWDNVGLPAILRTL